MKAGSWGARTVEKIVRVTERALARRAADLLVHRLGRRADHRPGRPVPRPPRRGPDLRQPGRAVAARCRRSAACSDPSAAGGAYIPAFCDVVIMVEGNASMYLGSPRMAEMVIGETVTLEEMGGARMHATVSGCGDNLAADDADAIEQAKLLLLLPAAELARARRRRTTRPSRRRADSTTSVVPSRESAPFDMHAVIDGAGRRRLVLRAQAAVRGRAGHRLRAGSTGAPSASSPTTGGARAACCSATRPTRRARFIWMCDAFNIPLLYLADVPGFMIGSAGRAAGHHPARREDDHRGRRGDRAEDLGDRPQGVRRRALRDGRPGVRPGRVPRAADGEDRRDGPGGRGERGLRQQDRRRSPTRPSARRTSRERAPSTRRTST